MDYIDVGWASWRLKSSGTQLFVQLFVQTYMIENTDAPRYKPFGRGNPFTKSQLCGDFSHHDIVFYIYHCLVCHNWIAAASFITLTSQWPRWRLKSLASRLFTEPFIRAQIKKKHQSSASLAFVRGIHRGPVNSPHKWPVTRKMFPFDGVIMLVPSYHQMGM